MERIDVLVRSIAGVLLPPPWQGPLGRSVIGVRRGIDDAHWGFAALFFERMSRQAGDARDDQQRIGDLRREPHVAANRGDGAVDVGGERPFAQGLVFRSACSIARRRCA